MRMSPTVHSLSVDHGSRVEQKMTRFPYNRLRGLMRQRMLRQIAAVLVFVFVPSALLAAQSAQTVVHVTRTGAKYHTAACRDLSRSDIPMTLGEASKRFGPCSVCKPPVLAAGAPAPGLTTRTPPSSKAVVSGQCQATTKKGTQCSRNAKSGSRFCWQHER